MRLAIRIFLYGILSLVIALWLVLGLFKPDYLKAPLVPGSSSRPACR